MNNHEINMYVDKFKEQMTFATKKQEYNFKTKINDYSTRDTFNLAYELFKLCIEKDKQLERLKEGHKDLQEEIDRLLDQKDQDEEFYKELWDNYIDEVEKLKEENEKKALSLVLSLFS